MTQVKELIKERLRAISIEYLPTEKEADPKQPLTVGQGLMDNFSRTEMLGYQTFFGVKRYLCGLDPEAVRYNLSLTEEERTAKIAEITEIVGRLEQFFGKGTLDATNEKHWSKIELKIDRKTTNLNLTDPKTELLLHCIRGGGFTSVAPSLEIARDTGAKFYLVEPIEYAESRIAGKEVVNKAISTLQRLYENKSYDDIFFLGKYILPDEKGYTRRTPKAMIYEDLDKYINGEMSNRQSKISCSRIFLEITKKTKAELAITCIVKDAVYYNFVYINDKGEFKNNETGGIYGTSIERVVTHLMNPAYEHELENIKTRVEQKWAE